MFSYTNAFSCLSVDTFRKAKTFYGITLGLTVSDSGNWLAVQLKGGNTLYLYEDMNHKPAAYTVLNFQVDNFDLAVEQLEKRGVVISYDNPNSGQDSASDDGKKIGWFEDLAGNIISLTQN